MPWINKYKKADSVVICHHATTSGINFSRFGPLRIQFFDKVDGCTPNWVENYDQKFNDCKNLSSAQHRLASNQVS